MTEARMDTYFRQRLQRRFYCGDRSSLDVPSLPLTELSVDYFRDSVPGKLGHVDMFSASNVIRRNHVSPCSVVLSMLYAKRLRQQKQQQKHLLQAMSSADVFFISMMMASKYLYDEGVDEEVFNDEWADNTDQDVQEVNHMETDFLQAMDWKLFVQPHEFEDTLAAIERSLALQEGYKRGWFTYTELDVLMNSDLLWMLWSNVGSECSKLLSAISAAYVTSVFHMMGSTALAIQISGHLSSITLAILTLQSSPLTPAVHPELSAHTFNLSSLHLTWMPPAVDCVHPQEAELSRSLVWSFDDALYRSQNDELDSRYKHGSEIDAAESGCGEIQNNLYRGDSLVAPTKLSLWLLWFVDTLLSQAWANVCVRARQAFPAPEKHSHEESDHRFSVRHMLQVKKQQRNHKQENVHKAMGRISRLSKTVFQVEVKPLVEILEPLSSSQCSDCSCSSPDWLQMASDEDHINAQVHCQPLDVQTHRLLSEVPHQPHTCIFPAKCHSDNCLSHHSCTRASFQRNPHKMRHGQSVYAEPPKDAAVDGQFHSQHQTSLLGIPVGFVTSVYQSLMIT